MDNLEEYCEENNHDGGCDKHVFSCNRSRHGDSQTESNGSTKTAVGQNELIHFGELFVTEFVQYPALD